RAVCCENAACFNAGKVEKGVYKAEEPRAVAIHKFKLLCSGRSQVGLAARQQILQRAEHQGKRRAKFVADVAEERGLGAIDFSKCFGALALFFISARIGNADGDLR